MQRPRNYTYVTHPPHLPLQLSGHSKKTTVPLRKRDFNAQQPAIHQVSRSLLMQKIANKPKQFPEHKCVVPQDQRKNKAKHSSIKVYQSEKQGMGVSGVEYLMHKSTLQQEINHKQKAHLYEPYHSRPSNTGKKHYLIQNQECCDELTTERVHRQTAETRLANDMYSNPFRPQEQEQPHKKLQPNNFFKHGVELGYESRKPKAVSDHKMVEMMGSEYGRKRQGAGKERRQDWRVSSINFA